MVLAQSDIKIRREFRQGAGCGATEKKKASFRPSLSGGNDFLRHRFLPVRENNNELKKAQGKIEACFFASLRHLSVLYKFDIPRVIKYPFPFNITIALSQAKEQLKTLAPDLRLIIIQDETRPACLATVALCNTGTMLYYIPVRPLSDLLKIKQKKKLSLLVLSVFSYLNHIVKVPYHYENDTYLGYCYEVIEEWYLDTGEQDKSELLKNMRELKTMHRRSRTIYRQIRSLPHLTQFQKRLNKFVPIDKAESDFLKLVKKVYELWHLYPHRSIFDSIPYRLLDPEIEERVSPDNYLSFFWDSEDGIYDSLMEYINADLQEYGAIDEPVSIQFFDERQITQSHDLRFETTLFSLLDELCFTLNKLI